MRLLLEHEDAGAAGYFLQQSLEKYLKAYLLGRGWKLRKIHELDALLDHAVGYDPGLEAFRDLCERVSGYYFAERYPPLGGERSSCEYIAKDAEEAEKLIQALFEKPA
jgi:HEPN domain-containing protein